MKTKTNYVGNWKANNGSTGGHGYKSTNKNALAAELRKICSGNTFKGNAGEWSVYIMTESGPEEMPVLAGFVRR